MKTIRTKEEFLERGYECKNSFCYKKELDNFSNDISKDSFNVVSFDGIRNIIYLSKKEYEDYFYSGSYYEDYGTYITYKPIIWNEFFFNEVNWLLGKE